jgi:hypothetical protein
MTFASLLAVLSVSLFASGCATLPLGIIGAVAFTVPIRPPRAEAEGERPHEPVRAQRE